MACNPTLCPDCSYPPNFSLSNLIKREGEPQKYEIECRDCGDIWIEIDDEDPNDIE